ncbi:Alpha/beta hydrolase fold-3 [Artemisia annua]|uniref:Alpha/beta hydrolase fold-3 n=1 Tax=Artemisia annua TaxID=35608 RepID=A0A2U1KQJ5_ARTAN|nr:Alpha/beta hydrolase fold-3 [Artemisia annua]
MRNPNSSSDPNRFFRITQNADGSVTRLTSLPSLPATPRLTTDSQLTLSKDIPLNATNKTFMRLFRPVSMPQTSTRKLSMPQTSTTGTRFVWSLSLPEGCDREHKYCNPLRDLGKSHSEKIRLLLKCLIRGYGGDPLVDRQKDFATMLEARGVHLITKFDDEGCHGVEMVDRRKAKVLYDDIKSFIWSLVKNKSSL